MSAEVSRNDNGSTLTPVVDITSAIHGISERVIKYGGWSDVYTGFWHREGGDIKVALKVYRNSSAMDAKTKSRLQHEISVWTKLSHPNVHEMCGVYNGIGPLPALVSLWAQEGHINEFLKKHAADVDVKDLKFTLIVSGLEYLHDCKIVHGDIKGGNVLISDDGTARLADFGLSTILVEHSQSFTHSTAVKGTCRWMAPELFLDERPRLTFETDVWACGCLFIEILSGKVPYWNKETDQQVIIALSELQPPPPPPHTKVPFWEVICQCCDVNRRFRPPAKEIPNRFYFYRTLERIDRLIPGGNGKNETRKSFLSDISRALRRRNPPVDLKQFFLSSDAELATRVLDCLVTWNGTPPLVVYPTSLLQLCSKRASDQRPGRNSTEDSASDRKFSAPMLRPLAQLLALISPAHATELMRQHSDPSEPMASIDFGKFLFAISWIPGGDHLVLAGADGLRVVQLDSSASEPVVQLDHFRGHPGWVRGAAVSPSGDLVLSFAEDKTIRLWDVQTRVQIGDSITTHADGIVALAVMPDNTRFVSLSNGTIRVWSIETRTTIRVIRQRSLLRMFTFWRSVTCIIPCPQSSRIIAGFSDNTLRICDSQTGAWVLGPLRGHKKSVTCVAISPDGTRVVSGSDDQTLRIWDAHTGHSHGAALTGHTAGVSCIAYSSNGALIASGSRDGAVRVWNVDTATSIPRSLQGFPNPVTCVAFSSDARQLAAAYLSGTVRIWDMSDDWMRWDI